MLVKFTLPYYENQRFFFLAVFMVGQVGRGRFELYIYLASPRARYRLEPGATLIRVILAMGIWDALCTLLRATNAPTCDTVVIHGRRKGSWGAIGAESAFWIHVVGGPWSTPVRRVSFGFPRKI